MITTEEFKEDVFTWAKELNVKPKEIHFREMKRKWASCSSRGRLTFSPSVLQESKKARMEIILHELLHMKYPNHGKMFTSLLKAYLNGDS